MKWWKENADHKQRCGHAGLGRPYLLYGQVLYGMGGGQSPDPLTPVMARALGEEYPDLGGF